MKWTLTAALVFALTAAAWADVAGRSPNCGPVSGNTQEDLDAVMRFCAKGVAKSDDLSMPSVTGAYAMESILWIKVGEDFARAMRADRLRAEQLVKIWMKGWKMERGQRVVTVNVEWGDVTIAEGQTTVFSGDKVTIP